MTHSPSGAQRWHPTTNDLTFLSQTWHVPEDIDSVYNVEYGVGSRQHLDVEIEAMLYSDIHLDCDNQDIRSSFLSYIGETPGLPLARQKRILQSLVNAADIDKHKSNKESVDRSVLLWPQLPSNAQGRRMHVNLGPQHHLAPCTARPTPGVELFDGVDDVYNMIKIQLESLWSDFINTCRSLPRQRIKSLDCEPWSSLRKRLDDIFTLCDRMHMDCIDHDGIPDLIVENVDSSRGINSMITCRHGVVDDYFQFVKFIANAAGGSEPTVGLHILRQCGMEVDVACMRYTWTVSRIDSESADLDGIAQAMSIDNVEMNNDKKRSHDTVPDSNTRGITSADDPYFIDIPVEHPWKRRADDVPTPGRYSVKQRPVPDYLSRFPVYNNSTKTWNLSPILIVAPCTNYCVPHKTLKDIVTYYYGVFKSLPQHQHWRDIVDVERPESDVTSEPESVHAVQDDYEYDEPVDLAVVRQLLWSKK